MCVCGSIVLFMVKQTKTNKTEEKKKNVLVLQFGKNNFYNRSHYDSLKKLIKIYIYTNLLFKRNFSHSGYSPPDSKLQHRRESEREREGGGGGREGEREGEREKRERQTDRQRNRELKQTDRDRDRERCNSTNLNT